MESRTYYNARVFSGEQNLGRQIAAFEAPWSAGAGNYYG